MDDLSELQKVLSFITSQMELYKEHLKFLSSYLALLGYIPHPVVVALLLPKISYHRSLTRSWHHLCEVKMGSNYSNFLSYEKLR